jgi:hypothetical protein
MELKIMGYGFFPEKRLHVDIRSKIHPYHRCGPSSQGEQFSQKSSNISKLSDCASSCVQMGDDISKQPNGFV